ncbi:MAG: PEP-CTERM sorting domain-containing protein [Planctomycetota bacterium]|nr:PEP-CTERM sorting domain-containing protein [Planctomycetota bacterium]
MSNPSILLRVAAVVLATQVGMTAAHAGLVNGFSGSQAFDSSDAVGTVFYTVVFEADGITEARFKTATSFGGSFANDATILNDEDNVIDNVAFDQTSKYAFLYQIVGGDGAKIEDLLIQRFGFTPSSMGYISGYHLAANGTISENATNDNPSSSESQGAIDSDTGAFRFNAIGALTSSIEEDDRSAILYATFATDTGVGTASGQVRADSANVRVDLPSPNPEPGSLALLGAAVAGFGGFRRFRRRRSAEQQPEESEADTDSTPELG